GRSCPCRLWPGERRRGKIGQAGPRGTPSVSALLASVAILDVHPADLDDVAALERGSFPVPWKRDYFAAEVGAAHRFNRVIRGEDGELIGYVFCAFAAGEIHVNKIA